MNYSDDIETLSDLRLGDRKAFDVLYLKYSPIIYSRLLQFLKDPSVAEELLQDVFLRIWLMRTEIDHTKGFKTFLIRITDNLAIDVFRKMIKDTKMRAELWYQLNSQYEELDQVLDHREQKNILEDTLAKLTPRQREIFVKCKLEDRSYKEVAEQMGLSVSTVSNHLVLAVKEVKAALKKHYSDYKFMVLIICMLDYIMRKI
ncbi:MAG: RNA polymerase sigma factor [Sphingobacterium sp.]